MHNYESYRDKSYVTAKKNKKQNEADFSQKMSLNACKAGHKIHDFFKPDLSPISSGIKHIIVIFPRRILRGN